MSKYTAEQVAREADLQEDRVADMLRDYAALLRERESAKAVVTDEIVRIASDARYVAITGDSPAPPNRCEESDAAMRAALEAVAPMLASARVPDEIRENDPRVFKGWSSPDAAYRAGWNQCRAAMLVAAPKPETEE